MKVGLDDHGCLTCGKAVSRKSGYCQKHEPVRTCGAWGCKAEIESRNSSGLCLKHKKARAVRAKCGDL